MYKENVSTLNIKKNLELLVEKELLKSFYVSQNAV